MSGKFSAVGDLELRSKNEAALLANRKKPASQRRFRPLRIFGAERRLGALLRTNMATRKRMMN